MVDLSALIEEFSKNKDLSVPIVLFGSSNTALSYKCSHGRLTWGEWFLINLNKTKGYQFKTINSGIGGNTTVDLLSRIDRDVLFYQPKIVIITVGGNDCRLDLGREVYRSNLLQIINKIKSIGATPVLQTYYCFDYSVLEGSTPDYKERIEKEFPLYMDVVREISKELNLPLIDQYKYFEPLYRREPNTYKGLMIDAMHVSYIGNFIIGNNVSRAFGLPELEIPQDFQEEISFYLNKLESMQ